MPHSSPDLFSQPPMERAMAKRNVVLKIVEDHAGKPFVWKAREFVLSYLREHGPCSGEFLTDRCKEAGIVPVNGDRAFGAEIGRAHV